jgi:phosphoglucosamine mutase
LIAARLAVEEHLGQSGRILIRASGTEPVLRVMVEAESEKQARESAERLALSLPKAA